MSPQPVNRLNAERYSDRPREDISSWFGKPRDYLENAVHEKPMTTVLTLFGVGLGVGAIIGGMLASQSLSRKRQQETLKERMADSMRQAVPNSVKHYFRG